MSSRSLRRAAAHRVLKAAQKAARKASALQPAAVASEEINSPETLAPESLAAETTTEESTPAPIPAEPPNAPSEAQLAANRANALKSTGPRTPDGKSKVSLNAVKSALTGRTVVLPSDDAALYQAHLRAFEKICAPVGHLEACLTQTLADTQWRLDRIHALELALFAKGRQEFSDLFEIQDPTNNSMLDLHTATVYEKLFRNFHTQDSRLGRRYQTSWAQLMALQKARLAEKQAALESAAEAYLLAKHRNQPFDLAQIGFEFSKPLFLNFLAGLPPVRREELLQKALGRAASYAADAAAVARAAA
jgi:hypothetical protein